MDAFKNEVLAQLEKFSPVSKRTLCLISALCTEPGIKVHSFFKVIESLFPEELPYQLQTAIDGLQLGNWISIVGDEVRAISEIATVLEKCDMIEDLLPEIMSRLEILTATTPNDELLSRKPFIRMGYAALRYCYSKNRLESENDAILFGRLAVNIVRNMDLTGALGHVHEIYQHPIYKMLEKVRIHVDANSSLYCELCLVQASLCNMIFDYDNANQLIGNAKKIAVRQGFNDTLVQVYIRESDILLNMTLISGALYTLKLAYDLNELLHGEGCQQNDEVVIRISNLCNIAGDKKTSKRWFELCGNNVPRYSKLYIYRKLIEGELYDEIEFATQCFDDVELTSYRLYGYTLPYIYICRSRYYDMHGYSEGNIEYGKFMRATRSLYGVTTGGDLSVYYASKVMTSLSCGAVQTAVQLNRLAIDLCPADAQWFSFGARVSQYLAIASTYCYATHDNVLACAYSSAVLEQHQHYLTLSNEDVSVIATIFGSREKIPACVFGLDLVRNAYQIKADVAIHEGRLEDARSLCLECLKIVRGTEEECYILSCLGFVYCKLGKVSDAIEVWKKAAETSGEHALEIAANSAWFAYDSGNLNIAIDIINNVSEESMAMTSPAFYSCYTTMADILATAGLQDQKEAFYAKARKMARGRTQYARCLYYEALELQDQLAINRLEHAVNCEADPGLCVDEELALRFKALAENRNALGLRTAAKAAAIQAVRLYPAECVDWEDIDELL
mgnify:CR=1 FL=1